MTSSLDETEKDIEKVPRWNSYRFALSGWGFFATLCLYVLRINFSVAIVCMTYEVEENDTLAGNGTSLGDEEGETGASLRWMVYGKAEEEEDCSDNSTVSVNETGEFDWDRELRGILSSSFFWGYVLTQFFGGWLAQRIGGKHVITVGMGISVLMSLLAPPAARISPYALLATRFINGLGQGVFYPAYYVMVGYWFPLSERAILTSIMGTGATLGVVISFALSGVMCEQLGWPWVFYTYSLLTVVFIVCWCLFVYDTPALHPRISQAERKFLEAELQEVKGNKMPPIPWRGLLTDAAMWCLVLADFCNGWASYAGLTQLPQYMEDVLQFDITKNGLYSALPSLVKIFTNIGFAVLGDYIIHLHIMRVVTLRKIMTSIAMLIPMCFVIGVGYLDCSTAGLAILFLTLQEGFNGATKAGWPVSRVDIAPPFSGITVGICNTSGNVAGIFAPLVIAMITADGTREQWQLCFLMSALMYIVAWLAFMVFGKSDVQPYAKLDSGITNMALEITDEAIEDTSKKMPGSSFCSSQKVPVDSQDQITRL